MIHERDRLVLEAVRERERAVAEQVDLGVVLVLGQRFRKLKRFVQTRDVANGKLDVRDQDLLLCYELKGS